MNYLTSRLTNHKTFLFACLVIIRSDGTLVEFLPRHPIVGMHLSDFTLNVKWEVGLVPEKERVSTLLASGLDTV